LWLYDPTAGKPRLMTTAFDGYDMCLQPSGEVFCGSGGTLLTRQGGRLTRRQLPTAAPLSSVVALPGGGYLVSAIGDGLYVLDAQFAVRQHHTMANSMLNGDRIRRLVSDSQGNVWFCTGSPGVMRYDARSGRLSLLTMKGQFSQSPSMWRNDVRIIEDSQHHLWVSPSGNGLALYDPARRMLVPFSRPGPPARVDGREHGGRPLCRPAGQPLVQWQIYRTAEGHLHLLTVQAARHARRYRRR
jgi:streptogramin lyase